MADLRTRFIEDYAGGLLNVARQELSSTGEVLAQDGFVQGVTLFVEDGRGVKSGLRLGDAVAECVDPTTETGIVNVRSADRTYAKIRDLKAFATAVASAQGALTESVTESFTNLEGAFESLENDVQQYKTQVNDLIDLQNTVQVGIVPDSVLSRISGVESSLGIGGSVDYVSNWNTAYSWGDHSTQGYLDLQSINLLSINSLVDVDTETSPPEVGQILSWSSNGTWVPSYTSSSDSNIFSVVTNPPQSEGFLSYSPSTGIFTFTPPDLSRYITAFDISAVNTNPSGSGSLNYSPENLTFSFTPPDLSGYLNSSASVNSLSDVDTASITPQADNVLAWDGSNWVPKSLSLIQSNGISLTDLSVTSLAASGSGSLSYSNTTGVFTYTPPEPSSLLSSVSINSLSDVNTSSSLPQADNVLAWDGSNWVPKSLSLIQSNGISLTDLSVTSLAASGSGSLSYSNTTGVFTYTPPDLSSYLSTSSSINSLSDIDTSTSPPNDGDILVWSATQSKWLPGPNTASSGSTSLVTKTKTLTTAVVPSGQSINVDLTGMPKVFLILELYTYISSVTVVETGAIWTTVYNNSTSRSLDASRDISRDPVPGFGVIVETMTNGIQKIVPPVAATTDIRISYFKLVNLTSVDSSIEFYIKYLPLEE